MQEGLLNYVARVLGDSGGVGLIIALFLFVCLGIALERGLFWLRLLGPFGVLGLRRRGAAERAAGNVERLVRRGQFSEAAETAAASSSPALRALAEPLGQMRTAGAWEKVRDQAMASSLEPNLMLGRGFLVTAIQGFGLLGMLGTCKGLYAQLSSFGEMASSQAGLGGAMSGMGEAFTTTLVGLSAAAITTLIYFPNEMAISRFQRRLRHFNGRIEAALAEYEEARG